MDVDAIEAERATFSAKKDESPSVADAERVSNGEVSEEGDGAPGVAVRRRRNARLRRNVARVANATANVVARRDTSSVSLRWITPRRARSWRRSRSTSLAAIRTRCARTRRHARADQPTAAAAAAAAARLAAATAASSAPPPHVATKHPGEDAVDRRVRVFWPEENAFFTGIVASYDGKTGTHVVHYDDGDVESVTLTKERMEWLEPDGAALPPPGGARWWCIRTATSPIPTNPRVVARGGAVAHGGRETVPA